MPTKPPTSTDRKPAISEMRAPSEDAAEDVAAQRVDAEPVRGRGPAVEHVVVEVVLGIEGTIHGANTAMHEHQQQHEQGGDDAHGCFLKRRQHSPQGVRTLPAVCDRGVTGMAAWKGGGFGEHAGGLRS